MPAIKYRIRLTQDERKELEAVVTRGSHRSQKVLSALILLNSDEGPCQTRRFKIEDISAMLQCSQMKINRVRSRLAEEGMDVALNGHKAQRAYSRKTDGDFEAHLIALSCGKPPEGHCRWSLRLLADKAVELEYVDSISHETVRGILKKTKSSHGGSKAG